MAGGAARLRAGSAGPVAAHAGPSRGNGSRWQTTPRASSRAGYPVTSSKAQRPVLPADPTPLHDLLEVCGSSLHTTRGVRPSTAGAAAVPSRGGIPRGPQRPNSFRASPAPYPPADLPDMARPVAAEPVHQTPTPEVEVEVTAEPEQSEDGDPWAQRIARLERIRLGLASVSIERPWAMPRPANEVSSMQSVAGQRQYGRARGCRGREPVLQNTEAEAAAVLAAAMSDAELATSGPTAATSSSSAGAQELCQPQQPPLATDFSEPPAGPVHCWMSPSAVSSSNMDHERQQDEVESPQRPPQVHGLCTPVLKGSDLLNAEVLYDSTVESSCSSINWPSASSRTGSKGIGEACIDPHSERLPEPSWSIESTVAATPDLMYRSRDSVGPHSVEAGLSVASSPSFFADISSGRSVGGYLSGDPSDSLPPQMERSNDVATMCLYGQAYGPAVPSSVVPGRSESASSNGDVAKPMMFQEQADLDSNLCCQGQAIAIQSLQRQASWQSHQPQRIDIKEHVHPDGDLCCQGQALLSEALQPAACQQLEQPQKCQEYFGRPTEPSFSSASCAPLLVHGHSIDVPGGSECVSACHASLEVEGCTPTESAEKLQTTAPGFRTFLDELRDLRSQALNGPPESVARFEECGALAQRHSEDAVVATSTEAVAHRVEHERFNPDLLASNGSYISAAQMEFELQQSEEEPLAVPITDGSTLLELQQFMRRAGVEDLMSVVCAHAADNLEALLALPAPAIRRLPAHRARLQRLIQALTTERGRRVCSWVAERNDVLRSQDVLRRASSVQRGTSGRRGTNRSQCTPASSRFQPGPRTRKAGASQPRSGEPPSRDSTCPRPRKAEKRDDEKHLKLARPNVPVPLMNPLAGATQAVSDGCDDAGFFITCLEGADTVSKSACSGSAEAQDEFFCPPTRSSSSTAPSSAPASSSASMPSPWVYTPAKNGKMSAPSLEQRLQLAPSMQSEQSQASVAEPPPQRHEALLQLPPRAPTGLVEQVLQAALPSARFSGPPPCASSRPQTRQARIRQLLQNVHEVNLIEIAPCPMEAARVDARQQQAYERHLRLRSRSPGGSRGHEGQRESSPFRRSRSLMELVSGGPTLRELSMADPPGWRPRQGPACPDPVPGELLDSLLDRLPTVAAAPGQFTETCTICLDLPEPGEMVTTLTCCHWYHRECIREWLTHSRLCPLCKASAIPPDDG